MAFFEQNKLAENLSLFKLCYQLLNQIILAFFSQKANFPNLSIIEQAADRALIIDYYQQKQKLFSDTLNLHLDKKIFFTNLILDWPLAHE